MASGYCSSNSDTELGLNYTTEPYLYESLKKNSEEVDKSSSDSVSDDNSQSSENDRDNW